MALRHSVVWRSRVREIRKALQGVKLFAALVILEQIAEALLSGVSLAEHPALVIACLGAFGIPLPGEHE